MPKFTKGHKVNLGRVPWNKIHREPPVYMPLPAREEVIWAAGFWEGEGGISRLSVNASQNFTWPLERLQRNFGGNIAPRKPSLNRPNEKPSWQWWLCGENARLFVELIRPHLSPRRQVQIERVFLTQEKFLQKKAEFKEGARLRAVKRSRSEQGRFDAGISEKAS